MMQEVQFIQMKINSWRFFFKLKYKPAGLYNSGESYHTYTNKNMQFTLQSTHNWSLALMLIGLVGGLCCIALW